MLVKLKYKKTRTQGKGRLNYGWLSLVTCDSKIHIGERKRLINCQSVKKGRGINSCKRCSGLALIGRVPWNKGKKTSFKTRQKISKNNAKYWLNKKLPKSAIIKKSGANHPLWNPDREDQMAKIKIAYACVRLLRRALDGKRKNNKTYIILGYNAIELKAHIESTWESWMNWNNYGTAKEYYKKITWQIDHIKPIIQFQKEGVADPKIINALSNLRALDTIENIKRKQSKKNPKRKYKYI